MASENIVGVHERVHIDRRITSARKEKSRKFHSSLQSYVRILSIVFSSYLHVVNWSVIDVRANYVYSFSLLLIIE